MMKKLNGFLILSILALALAPFAGLVAQTNSTSSVNTGFKKSEGGGEAPIIKVKWEMNNSTSTANNITTWNGEDDSNDAGAQFLPTC